MRYVALLRGINVGGKNIIKMVALKESFETCGFKNVTTYIQSGNVIFDSNERDVSKLENILEKELSKEFKYDSKAVLLSTGQLEQILGDVPEEWKKGSDLRCYMAFTKEPVTAKDVLGEVKLKDGVDSAKVGKNVLYMSTLLSGITKSGFTKLIGTKVYKSITIRNYSTAKKIFEVASRE